MILRVEGLIIEYKREFLCRAFSFKCKAIYL
jgi:hypothetical protein